MRLPGLHVVTDDEVLAADGFDERALRLLRAHGPAMAFHLRGPGTAASTLYDLAARLAPAATAAGAAFLINDRADIALAVDTVSGVQLPGRSLPVAAVRSLAPTWVVGASVHDPAEAAVAQGADFLLVGTIWETPSHPGRAGAGLARIREMGTLVDVPVVAIGGVTPERAAAARAAGGVGVAVVRGVWAAADAVEAASRYLKAMEPDRGAV